MKPTRAIANLLLVALFPAIWAGHTIITRYQGDLGLFLADIGTSLHAWASGFHALFGPFANGLASMLAWTVWVATPLFVGMMVHAIKMALTPGQTTKASAVGWLATIAVAALVWQTQDGAVFPLAFALGLAIWARGRANQAQDFPTSALIGAGGVAMAIIAALAWPAGLA